MSDRALRGSRLGTQSYEDDAGVELAARQAITYDCPRGHRFTMPFSVEADVPAVWDCTVCGVESLRVDHVRPEGKATKPARTHWDMLLERRTVADLEELLSERLELLRSGVVGGAVPRQAPAPRQTRRSA